MALSAGRLSKNALVTVPIKGVGMELCTDGVGGSDEQATDVGQRFTFRPGTATAQFSLARRIFAPLFAPNA